MSPKVSIVIPAFNYGCYIRDAIESVLSQSYCDYELIILNNASEDDTHDVVQEYLSDSRVRYICNEFNISASNLWVIIHRARTSLALCMEKNWF